MTEAAVATNLDQPLDAHLHLAAQFTFHLEVRSNIFTQGLHFRVGQILDTGIRIDAGGRNDLVRTSSANTKQIGQPNFNPLIAGKINTFYTCHSSLSLSLFMFRIVTNNIQAALALYDLALGASLL